MEPIRRNPQDINPGRTVPRQTAPIRPRQFVSDITVRPHARPVHTPTQPGASTSTNAARPQQPQQLPTRMGHPVTPGYAQSTTPQMPTSVANHPHGQYRVQQPQPLPVQTHVQAQGSTVRAHPTMPHASPYGHPPQAAPVAPTPNQMPGYSQTHGNKPTPAQPAPSPYISRQTQATPARTQSMPTSPNTSVQPAHPTQVRPHQISPHATVSKAIQRHSIKKRAGLIGFIVFVLLGGLLLSPFIPGKTFENFPAASQSTSSGDASLACVTPLKNITASTRYTQRLGSPITYNYATATTQQGTCNGKLQTAVTGHTGQFNPLGLLIDIGTVLVVAIAVTKVWRRFSPETD